MTITLDRTAAVRLVRALFGVLESVEGEEQPLERNNEPAASCPRAAVTGLTGDIIMKVFGKRLWEHIQLSPGRATELQTYSNGETHCVRMSITSQHSFLSIFLSTNVALEIWQRLK